MGKLVLYYFILQYTRVWVWPHFGIEPFERTQTYKRVLSFAFDDRLSAEKYIAYQFTIYLFYIGL